MIRASLASIAAQLLDLGTAHARTEVNPVVLALGTAAPFVKLGVLAFGLTVAFVLWRTRNRTAAGMVFAALVIVGCIGAVSNVAAR